MIKVQISWIRLDNDSTSAQLSQSLLLPGPMSDPVAPPKSISVLEEAWAILLWTFFWEPIVSSKGETIFRYAKVSSLKSCIRQTGPRCHGVLPTGCLSACREQIARGSTWGCWWVWKMMMLSTPNFPWNLLIWTFLLKVESILFTSVINCAA